MSPPPFGRILKVVIYRQRMRDSTSEPMPRLNLDKLGGGTGARFTLVCMESVHDVAAYVIGRQGSMAPTKFQKLVYYCQAWNLAWRGEPLFDSRIEAWVNGPVVRDLYRHHRLQPSVWEWPKGDADSVSEPARSVIDAVLGYYGSKSAFWLTELSHREEPWLKAREGVPANVRSDREITTEAMRKYYGALAQPG